MSGAERRLVLAWGGNAHGQLGLGDVAEHLTPSALPPLASPHSVCCGDYHSALVTADGALFTWGAGEAGQLGHGERRSSPSPRAVRGLHGTRVAAVACGARHTLARCAEGRVYAWGCGTFGALGLGLHAAEEVLRPALVESLPVAAAALAAGVYHSVALCEGGEVFAWGWGRHGQLGDGEVGSHAFAPARVRRREAWRGVASGAHHVLAQAAAGELWAWGSGEAGQLGSGERRDEPLPREVCRGAFGGREVAQFACGERHSAALTDEGRVYCWGAGVFAPPAASHGGWPHAADEAVVATPSLVEPLCHARVRSIACGFHQVCAVTVEGDVLCWQAGSAAYVALPPVAAAINGLSDGLAGVEVGCVSLECGGYHTLAIVQPRRTAGRPKGLSSPPRRANGETREPPRDGVADETADAAAARRCGGGGARADGTAGVRACVVAAYEGAAGACATRREAPPLARVPSSYVRQMGAEEGAAMAAVLAELDQLVREVDEQKRETARRKQEYEQELEEFRREASGAEELRQKLDSSRRKLKEERQRADALQEERDQLVEKLDARATANAEVCRQHDRALRAASADARRRALLCSIVARYESGLHTRALQQWRRATARIAVAQAESIAARHAFAAIKSESHTRAALLVARLLHPPPLPPRLAWQLWASAAAALRASHASRRAAAARAAQAHAEATTAAVRRCYAADKLGALLCDRGGASLRLALCRWAVAAAREEAARLEPQLAAETAHAAALSDRLAEAEARAAAPFGSPRGKLRERLEAEREAREARRQAEALAARVRLLEAERGAAAAAAPRGEAAEAAVAAARHEVRALRRYAALAGGAHRFARWRLLLGAMRVKRAEARAALAEASTARLVAAARGAGAAAGEAAAWRAKVRRGALRRLVAPPPHGAMARALWRWRAAGVMVEAAAAARQAAEAAAGWSAAGVGEAAHEEMLCEAIRVGDAQTQRVLQLQRAVLVARRRLAASLLHVVLSSLLRSLLVRWLHQWALVTSTHCRLRAVRDARAAKADASRLSSRVSSLEGDLQHAKAAAAAEAEAARRKLLAAERAKGSLRAECAQAAQALQAEQQASARERERRAAEALEATRAQSANSRHEQELAAAYGENAELERQLRALRAQLRAAALGERTPPASPRPSPARTREDREGIAKGGGAAAIERLERQLRLEREEKDQCESNRTRAVRDLRACKEELAAARRAAAAAARGAALARILAFARSRFGRCAQLLRLLHALRDWHDFTYLRAPAAPAGRRADGRPPRAPPVASRRHGTLHALRVLLQQRALRWSLQMRYRCLLRWRTAAATAQWVEQGGAPRSERLHELLREVQIMKAAVGGTVARTPATRPGAY